MLLQFFERASLCAVICVAALVTLAGPVGASSGPETSQQNTGPAAADSGTPGKLPKRILLVISDEVRSYKAFIVAKHVEFGSALAEKMEAVLKDTFATVTTVTETPTDSHALDNVDFVVIVEKVRGSGHPGLLMNAPMTLTADFVLRTARGDEVLRTEESAKDSARNVGNGRDRLVEAVTSQFLQKLLASDPLRNLPSSKRTTDPAASISDSAGVEMPPPPPWARMARTPGAPLPILLSDSGRP